MWRRSTILALLLSLAVMLAPAMGLARAGSGGSFGSRGSQTYLAPPSTRTSPYGAAPIDRSLTSRGAPSYGYGAPAYGFGGRSPFMSGLLGGLVGAGIAGLLFGHGLFWGVRGFGGLLGLLLQIAIIVWLVRWVLRRVFAQQSAYAGNSGYARGPAVAGSVPYAGGGSAPPRGLQIEPSDYHAFEQLLRAVQAAWSDQDLHRMRQLATPELVGVFADQLAEQSSRGIRNLVTDVRLEQGDLAEAWSEDGRDYATVAMRFAMHDATRDSAGRIVDGSLTEWISTVEHWTFVRARGGQWVLSAIQQQGR